MSLIISLNISSIDTCYRVDNLIREICPFLTVTDNPITHPIQRRTQLRCRVERDSRRVDGRPDITYQKSGKSYGAVSYDSLDRSTHYQPRRKIISIMEQILQMDGVRAQEPYFEDDAVFMRLIDCTYPASYSRIPQICS
jgi:hypothetical protein